MDFILQPEDSKRVADAMIKEIESAVWDFDVAKAIAEELNKSDFISLRLTEAFNRLDLDLAAAFERQLRPSGMMDSRDSLGDLIAENIAKAKKR
jgi:hypothetical protein